MTAPPPSGELDAEEMARRLAECKQTCERHYGLARYWEETWRFDTAKLNASLDSEIAQNEHLAVARRNAEAQLAESPDSRLAARVRAEPDDGMLEAVTRDFVRGAFDNWEALSQDTRLFWGDKIRGVIAAYRAAVIEEK